jgi:hypothetical protein
MSPEEIVDGQLAAYNDHDLDAFLDFFAENVEVRSFPSGEVIADRSGTAFQERYRALFAANPDAHAELISRVAKGSIIIDQERITSSTADEPVRHVVAMYEVAEKKVERMWFVY